MKIDSVSSINLRKHVDSPCKDIDDDISVECTGCSKKKQLGSETCVIVKVKYTIGEVQQDLHLCDTCCDIFVDLLRYGKHVIYSDWKRKSFTKRFTGVYEKSYCFKCFNSSKSHIFFKYVSEEGIESGDKVCASCACTYFELIQETDLSEFEYPFMGEDDEVTISGGRI